MFESMQTITVTIHERIGEADGSAVYSSHDHRAIDVPLSRAEGLTQTGDVRAEKAITHIDPDGFGTWSVKAGDEITVNGERTRVIDAVPVKRLTTGRVHHVEVTRA